VKTILLSQRLTNVEAYDETRECLDIRWASFLKECGLIPVAVPINGNVVDYFSAFNPVGILLTGGNDLSCCCPGDDLCKKRDSFERGLVKEAIDRDLSLLGVCRGMQLIAHYFSLSMKRVEGHVTESHPISIQVNSRFGRFYEKHCVVNSYHNFSISDIKDAFDISARMAEDNVIEAFEHGEYDIAGMMWHPERVEPFDKRDISFFKEFFSNGPPN